MTSTDQKITVEDCYTACAALQEGITDLLKNQGDKAIIGETTQFVALGGTAIAAITSPFLPTGSPALILCNDIFRRQTKDVDVELKCKVDAKTLGGLLAKLGMLPTHPTVGSPAGIFAASSNGFALKRDKIIPQGVDGNGRLLPPIDRPTDSGIKYDPVEFDAHDASNSRLQYYINPGSIFDAANVTEYKGRAVAFKVLKAPLLVLLKLSSFLGRRERDPEKANADFVDVRLLLTFADKLGVNRAAFDRFRSFVPPEVQAQGNFTIKQLADYLATLVDGNGHAKDAGNALATQLVQFEIKNHYYFWNMGSATQIDQKPVDDAKALWIGYFKQLYDLLKA